VAYNSLLHERQRALHARIVNAIEALHPDRLIEQVEQLADVLAKDIERHSLALVQS
jgi:hypothetical protein